MDEIAFWRVFLVFGSALALGGSGLFAIKLLLSTTGRRKIMDIFSRR